MTSPAYAAQARYAYRFDWGPAGLAAIAGDAGVVVVVDVLRFTTVVDVAVTRGAVVEPVPRAPTDLAELSPAALAPVLGGRRLALASPNGGALARLAADTGSVVLAAALRNARAVADAARTLAAGRPVAVLAAGERWPDGTLRPCVEDLLGAGAVLLALDPSGSVSAPACSPEAATARAAYAAARFRIREALDGAASARELRERGFGADVDWAAAADVSTTVPAWRDGAFRPL